MQLHFFKEQGPRKNNSSHEKFIFPDVGTYPTPADFYTIFQDYKTFLEKNNLATEKNSWNKSFEELYKRYTYHITGRLDHSKTSFKKTLEDMEKSAKKLTAPSSHIKEVHDYYAQQRQQNVRDELELLGRVDEDGYADY